MRAFKAGLLAREADAMDEMARRWLEVEAALEAEISLLAREVGEMAGRGERVSVGRVARLARYRRLLAQAEREVGRYVGWCADEVGRRQAALARLGVEQAGELIRLAYSGVGVDFDRLPVEAVAYMAGMAGDGKPLGELLRRRMVRDEDGLPLPGVWERLTGTLVRGTALGWNPVKVARLMRDDLAGGLQKALQVARSEQMRVYREASAAQYRESGVVRGQKRMAAHDERVCAACLADEGRFYGLDEVLYDHPQGRCTGIPVVKGREEPSWLMGEAWLRTQAEGVQRSILGKGRYELWKNKELKLREMMQETYDPVWGKGLRVRKLEENIFTEKGWNVFSPNRDDASIVGRVSDDLYNVVHPRTGVREIYVVNSVREHYRETHEGQFDIDYAESLLETVFIKPRYVYQGRKKTTLLFVADYDATKYLLAPVKCLEGEMWLETMYVEGKDRFERRWKGRERFYGY